MLSRTTALPPHSEAQQGTRPLLTPGSKLTRGQTGGTRFPAPLLVHAHTHSTQRSSAPRSAPMPRVWPTAVLRPPAAVQAPSPRGHSGARSPPASGAPHRARCARPRRGETAPNNREAQQVRKPSQDARLSSLAHTTRKPPQTPNLKSKGTPSERAGGEEQVGRGERGAREPWRRPVRRKRSHKRVPPTPAW